jgi:hypothetical protein
MFAALGGFLRVLQWLRSQDPPCPIDERTFAAAAETGDVEMLQWLCTQDPQRGCSFDGHATEDSTGLRGDLSGGSDVWEDYLMDDLPD